MKKLPLFILIILVIASTSYAWDVKEKYNGAKTPTTDLTWHPDILSGYEARYVDQGEAFDGPCRSTIVRMLNPNKSKRAYLYIHGFNDYFFQSEMGQRFVDSGFNFYAVDLRRYGRSKEPWQYPYNIRDMKEYFADIDSAISQIRNDGNTDITLSGHSTGGLTVILFAALKGKNPGVDRVVTDSPFLEWNFSSFMRNIAAPTIGFIGKIFKNTKIKQGHCDGYAYSLLKQFDGEWTYNTDWKMTYSPPVTASWVGAINSAQGKIIKKSDNICIPVLIMCSSRKVAGCNYTPAFKTGDAVLDPFMIREKGEALRCVKEICVIDSGIHDLILSEPSPRQAAYDSIFSFIRQH